MKVLYYNPLSKRLDYLHEKEEKLIDFYSIYASHKFVVLQYSLMKNTSGYMRILKSFHYFSPIQ